MRQAPQLNNFTKSLKPENKDLKNGTEGESGDEHVDAQHDWILKELDFDKVMKQRDIDNAAGAAINEHPVTQHDFEDKVNNNVGATKDKIGDDIFDVEHPMDLSFTKDINYGKRGGEKGYASEDDDERKKVKGPPIGDDDF